GQYRRHAPVDRIEAVALAEEIIRRLGRAADAGKLRQPVRLDVELEASLDDGGADGIMAAAGAERRNRTFIIAVREAENVLGQRRMVEFRFGQIGHSAASLALICRRSAIAAVMNRAVIGVPS